MTRFKTETEMINKCDIHSFFLSEYEFIRLWSELAVLKYKKV